MPLHCPKEPLTFSLHFTFFKLSLKTSLHFTSLFLSINSLPLTSLPFTFYRLHFPSLVFTSLTLVLKICFLPREGPVALSDSWYFNNPLLRNRQKWPKFWNPQYPYSGITSIYQPTNAHIISHKTLLKHFKTLRHASILSDHHQLALFLAKVSHYSA